MLDKQIRSLCISIHALTRRATPPSIHGRGLGKDFNPRTHEECDLGCWISKSGHFVFQSTHSRGVRPHHQFMDEELERISIHALTRSATSSLSEYLTESIISIHALTRSATMVLDNDFLEEEISIHALTRSATFCRGLISWQSPISIHALTRSATFCRGLISWQSPISIPALTRSATMVLDNDFLDELISIHALTRSATGLRRAGGGAGNDFNPRTHEECDQEPASQKSATEYFNPRTHEECDCPRLA